ncbi:MAG: aspartate aminotransferase family protein [Verrucomicrobiae bacterium]|nr:aspartate aminotransferase family protein [Verrucomicrobiae bacterium]
MSLNIVELQKLDQSNYIHPFTDHLPMHQMGTHLIQSGEGCFLIDQNNHRLLDGLAGLWCVNVGYGCKEIIEAVNQQMQKLAYYPSFFNTATESAIQLANRIAQLAPTPRLKHTIFSESGSEANETALKIILNYQRLRGHPKKTKILTRTFAYHGVTLATTSMTGLASCLDPFGLPLAGFIHAPGPYHYLANTPLDPEAYGQWCLEETEKIILKENPETIAACFAEPIQGAGGVIVPPPGYLKGLRELCRKYDILFIADEVITAFGRMGCWFLSKIWNLDPDMITMAKGITSGYLPLGATLVSDEIINLIYRNGYFAHGYTYSGHTTSCAAALANLDVLDKEKIIPRVEQETGPYFQKRLSEFTEHKAIGEARGYGLIAALEIIPKEGKAALSPTANLGVKVAALAREEGVIVRGIRNLVAIAPPLIISKEEIDYLFDGVKRALNRLY